jgi:hypothetical protein
MQVSRKPESQESAGTREFRSVKARIDFSNVDECCMPLGGRPHPLSVPVATASKCDMDKKRRRSFSWFRGFLLQPLGRCQSDAQAKTAASTPWLLLVNYRSVEHASAGATLSASQT